MITLEQSVNNVLMRLDDEARKVYNLDRIENCIQDGYDHLVRETECLYDQFYDETIAVCGNLTCDDERAFLAPGTSAQFDCGLINFSCKDDFHMLYQVHMNGAVGPVQCTAPWEAQYDYVPDVINKDTFLVPEDTVQVERVAWDWRELYAEGSKRMEQIYARFKQNIQGMTKFFVFDSDGLFKIRLVPTPGTTGTTYQYEGYRGVLRNADDSEFGTESFEGSWGILRATDGHFQARSLYGAPVQLWSDDKNTKVEVLRRGRPLSSYGYEVPARFVKYAEFWALWRILLDEGPGQDLELGQHFKERYEEGKKLLQTRRDQVRMQRVGRMGGKPIVIEAPPVARLPWQYGEEITWNPSQYE